MNLGERLIELRKEKHLSQEELADKLGVSRQTVSKWELNQSTPDFDKIIPLCEIYEISPNQLLMVNEEEKKDTNIDYERAKKEKRTKGLVFGILLYFIAVVWIMISIPVLLINPIIAAGLFLLICGCATCIIIYTQIMYKKTKIEKEEHNNKLFKQIESILSIFTCIIYLFVSFTTMAWHITWIIWLIYSLVLEIVKLVLMLRGDSNEK